MLALLDLVAARGDTLSRRAGSLVLVLEGVLVIALLVVAIMGTQLPSDLTVWRVGPGSIMLLVVWTAGIAVIARARSGLPWQAEGEAPGSQESERGAAQDARRGESDRKGHSTHGWRWSSRRRRSSP